jgi:hypothetical protein
MDDNQIIKELLYVLGLLLYRDSNGHYYVAFNEGFSLNKLLGERVVELLNVNRKGKHGETNDRP